MSKKRCFGKDALDFQYHDTEWGIVSHDDRYLFEMLILEGAQAGLNWSLILKRRQAYKKAFCDFDPNQVAAMTDESLDILCATGSIIRNRRKIYSARNNAQSFLEIQKEFGSFDHFVWSFVGHRQIVNHYKTIDEVPCVSNESQALSKALKKRGMNFVGPTIMYSYMQAVGMVDDHLTDCWCKSK